MIPSGCDKSSYDKKTVLLALMDKLCLDIGHKFQTPSKVRDKRTLSSQSQRGKIKNAETKYKSRPIHYLFKDTMTKGTISTEKHLDINNDYESSMEV